MSDQRQGRRRRGFDQIRPWLWTIGSAYLVALVIALLADPEAATSFKKLIQMLAMK